MENKISTTGILVDFLDIQVQNYKQAGDNFNGKAFVYTPITYLGKSNDGRPLHIILPKEPRIIKHVLNTRDCVGANLFVRFTQTDIIAGSPAITSDVYSSIDSVRLSQNNIILITGTRPNKNGNFVKYVN